MRGIGRTSSTHDKRITHKHVAFAMCFVGLLTRLHMLSSECSLNSSSIQKTHAKETGKCRSCRTVKTEPEPYTRLQTILMSAEPIDRAPCDVHPFSLCQRPRVDIDTTTTPCRDYSLWNPAAKGRQGNDVAVLLGWCSIHKHDKTTSADP